MPVRDVRNYDFGDQRGVIAERDLTAADREAAGLPPIDALPPPIPAAEPHLTEEQSDA